MQESKCPQCDRPVTWEVGGMRCRSCGLVLAGNFPADDEPDLKLVDDDVNEWRYEVA